MGSDLNPMTLTMTSGDLEERSEGEMTRRGDEEEVGDGGQLDSRVNLNVAGG
jgi:hypothetical protein